MNISKCPHCSANLGNFMYADACPHCHKDLAHNRKATLLTRKATAVELQEKAVRFAKGQRKDQFQQTLDSYKEGKLPEPY